MGAKMRYAHPDFLMIERAQTMNAVKGGILLTFIVFFIAGLFIASGWNGAGPEAAFFCFQDATMGTVCTLE